MNDRRILYAATFLRAVATGLVGVLLAIYLKQLAFSDVQIGFVITVGLGTGALATLVATFFADRIGRRKYLIGAGVLGALGLAGLAAGSSVAGILVASALGMINGMGRDRGASFVLEQAVLPATVADDRRTFAFAWYSLLQDIGHAVGALAAASPELLRRFMHVDNVPAYRITLGLPVILTALSVLLYFRLSSAVEVERPSRGLPHIAPETRKTLWKISALFGLDSLSTGFLTTALLSFFFYKRFGIAETSLGLLFFAARIANALSHPAAAWMAKRIGLVNTMVFSHLPSSLFLVFAVMAPSFPIAAILFLLRESLVQMDVPTRQSYVMALVAPSERTFASGVTHIVRLAGWAVAPVIAGVVIQGASVAAPIFIGAGMKAGYDLLLFRGFRRVKPPEEVAQS